ncbi:MAG TPA: DUF805 domain-containing protein [Caulobacterales bacterium]|nr:DUF805 domain-containing protein [Caulobacterales bacterium]
MADIFLSYAREDRDRAAAIAAALEQAGYKSFWDVEIPPGSSWADFLEEKLASSKAAIVLWSKTSTASQWVREEARLARDRGKLIPVIIDGSSPPFGFGEIQAANLSHWQGDQNDSNWRLLVSAVERAVGAGAQPRPAPQPQPAYAPPPVAPQQTAYSPPPQNAAAVSPSPSPWGYFQKCLKPWINGKGRARRAEYWWFALFATVFMFGLLIVDLVISSAMGGVGWGPVLTVLGSLVLVGPAVSVAVRRLHDVGMNGWLYLLVLVPYAGALFLLVVALLPGQDKTNEYGPSPKAP